MTFSINMLINTNKKYFEIKYEEKSVYRRKKRIIDIPITKHSLFRLEKQ